MKSVSCSRVTRGSCLLINHQEISFYERAEVAVELRAKVHGAPEDFRQLVLQGEIIKTEVAGGAWAKIGEHINIAHCFIKVGAQNRTEQSQATNAMALTKIVNLSLIEVYG